jgi:transcriptional regulator with XRE-family HTH domain
MASETFADCLRKLREKAGLTTYALAKKAGLTKQALYRLEQGGNKPTWDTVQALARALDLDCRAFQTEEAATVKATPKKATRKKKEK